MAVVFSDRVIEIAVIQEMMGRPVVNVWHMQTSTELWPASATDVVEDFRNNWQDHVLDRQTAAIDVLRFEWRSLDESDASVGVVEPDPAKNTTGQRSADSFPPNVALLVNKRTTNRPRGARDGRAFIAAIEEGGADDRGAIGPASLTAYQAAFDDFYNGISDSGVFTNDERWPVVLETTPASRAPGPQPVTVNSRRVTSLVVDPLLSTQRDRLR